MEIVHIKRKTIFAVSTPNHKMPSQLLNCFNYIRLFKCVTGVLKYAHLLDNKCNNCFVYKTDCGTQ